MSFSDYVQRLWYQKKWGIWWLWPLQWVYGYLVQIRKASYKRSLERGAKGKFQSWKAPVPVIVLGNVTLGGTGKTPLTLALADILKKQGYRPAIISRGYGGKSDHYPVNVSQDTSPNEAGDEPVMLFARSDCPVVVSPFRVDAAQYVLSHFNCNILLCDDGLQHYALQRDLEICVIDTKRGVGNGHMLPVGPLRENLQRLSEVDFVIENLDNTAIPSASKDQEKISAVKEWRNYLAPSQWPEVGTMVFEVEKVMPVSSSSKEKVTSVQLDFFKGKQVHGVAGIGNPERFFDMLEKHGIEVCRHFFSDHHNYSTHSFNFNDGLPILMTEKDVVKCRSFNLKNAWFVSIEARLNEDFINNFLHRITLL